MKRAFLTILSLLASCAIESEPLEQTLTGESRSIEALNTNGAATFNEVDPDLNATESVEQLSEEPLEASIDPDVEPPLSTPEGTSEPITLDELLRQARSTPHLRQEALLARLAERRRLAIAVRATLDAAAQVAAFGEPGAQLLQDASLDAIVATMIAAREREHAEQATLTPSTPSATAIANQQPPQETHEEDDSNEAHGFDAWRPLYILRDSRGHKVGWRHQITGERAITYVGDRWEIGNDVVSIEGVGRNGTSRYIVVNMNGERREIDL